jgi:hypothetical protein
MSSVGGRRGGTICAGQSQGWGGTDIGLSMECLTRTGPLFQVKAEELEPLPNLAQILGMERRTVTKLTMHLIQGAKWSDGVPFTTGDAMFYWEDNVLDPNVTPAQWRDAPETFGRGYDAPRHSTIIPLLWTFKDALPQAVSLRRWPMASFCPGPAHILKPAASRNIRQQYLRAVQERVPARISQHPHHGRLGAGGVSRPTTSSSCGATPISGRLMRRATNCPISMNCITAFPPGPIAMCRPWPGSGDNSALEQPENYR